MQTEWRKSESCPFFLASSAGEIMVADTGKLARIMDNGHGYKQVQIMRNNKRYTRYVHRLVAECYLNNPENLPEINHKDGNKANNAVDNLEWCNRSQNQRHAYKTGLIKPSEKQKEAARRNALKSREALRAGWLRWSKTEEALKLQREKAQKNMKALREGWKEWAKTPEARESWLSKLEAVNSGRRRKTNNGQAGTV